MGEAKLIVDPEIRAAKRAVYLKGKRETEDARDIQRTQKSVLANFIRKSRIRAAIRGK